MAADQLQLAVQHLATTDLPVLSKDNLEPKDIALWLIELRRWASTNGFESIMFSEHDGGDLAEPQLAVRRDVFRYVIRAIGSTNLRNELSTLGDTGDPNRPFLAIEHIRRRWLAGRKTERVIEDELRRLEYSSPIQEFLAGFWVLYINTDPLLTAEAACELFATKLPEAMEPQVQLADQQPTRESVRVAGGGCRSLRSRADANVHLRGIHQ